MSNLFLLYNQLISLEESEKHSPAERAFFKTVNRLKLGTAYKLIKAEIKKPNLNPAYLKSLKEIDKSIEGILNHRKNLLNPIYVKTVTVNLDTIYHNTIHQFHGNVVLPINQSLDSYLGDSGGECFGYVADWGVQLLKNKKPFGINPNTSPFKPVPFNSRVGLKYPQLNHLGKLNIRIAYFQIAQLNASFLTSMMSHILSKTFSSKFIHKKSEQTLHYRGAATCAKKLIQLANKDSSKVYHIHLEWILSAHALGLCKHQGKYHFFDSNSGWYRFDNENDFIKWLPYYFNKMNYNGVKKFGFSSYSVAESMQPTKQKDKYKDKKSSKGENIAVAIIMFVLSPFVVLFILGSVIHEFLIPSIILATLNTLNWLKKKFHSSNDKNEKFLSDQPITKSVDDFEIRDINLNKKTSEHIIPSSYGTIAALLDIPLSKFKEAKIRASFNPEFKRTTSKTPVKVDKVQHDEENHTLKKLAK